MISKTETVYYCGHCGKAYFRRAACEKHEEICQKNPQNYSHCYACKYLTKTWAYRHDDNALLKKRVLIYWCPKLRKGLLSPIDQKRNKGSELIKRGGKVIEMIHMPRMGCDNWRSRS